MKVSCFKKTIKNKKNILLIIILFSIFYFLFSNPPPVFAQVKFIPQIGIPTDVEAGKEYPLVVGTKVSLLAKYVSNFYQWSVIAIAIIAVVVIVISGMRWILAAGNPSAIQKAREQMVSAIIGLVLVLLAIPVLNLINPALVRLSTFEIPYIIPKEPECQDICPINTIEIRGPSSAKTSMMTEDNIATNHLTKCENICGRGEKVTRCDWMGLQYNNKFYVSCCQCKECPTGIMKLPQEYKDKGKNCEDYCQDNFKASHSPKFFGPTYCTLSLPEDCCRCPVPDCKGGKEIKKDISDAAKECANYCSQQGKTEHSYSGPRYGPSGYEFYCCVCGEKIPQKCKEGETEVKIQRGVELTCCKYCFDRGKQVEICYGIKGKALLPEAVCVKCKDVERGKFACEEEWCAKWIGRGEVCMRHTDNQGIYKCVKKENRCENECILGQEACGKVSDPSLFTDCSCHSQGDYNCCFVGKDQPCQWVQQGKNACEKETDKNKCQCHEGGKGKCYQNIDSTPACFWQEW